MVVQTHVCMDVCTCGYTEACLLTACPHSTQGRTWEVTPCCNRHSGAVLIHHDVVSFFELFLDDVIQDLFWGWWSYSVLVVSFPREQLCGVLSASCSTDTSLNVNASCWFCVSSLCVGVRRVQSFHLSLRLLRLWLGRGLTLTCARVLARALVDVPGCPPTDTQDHTQ